MKHSRRNMSGLILAIGVAASWFFIAAAARAIEEGDARRYTTSYRHTDRTVDAFNVDDFSNAPLQIVVMANVEVTPERAFQLVAVELDKWFLAVGNIRFENAQSVNGPSEIGAGSVRSCDLDGELLVENIPYWQPDHAYAYSI